MKVKWFIASFFAGLAIWSALSIYDADQFPAALVVFAGLTGALVGGVFTWADSWPQRNLLIFLSGEAIACLLIQSFFATLLFAIVTTTVLYYVARSHPAILGDNRTEGK